MNLFREGFNGACRIDYLAEVGHSLRIKWDTHGYTKSNTQPSSNLGVDESLGYREHMCSCSDEHFQIHVYYFTKCLSGGTSIL